MADEQNPNKQQTPDSRTSRAIRAASKVRTQTRSRASKTRTRVKTSKAANRAASRAARSRKVKQKPGFGRAFLCA